LAFIGWLAWQAFFVCGLLGYGRVAGGLLGMSSLRNRLGSELILGMLAVGAIGGVLALTPVRGPLAWSAVLLVGVVRLGWDATRAIRSRGVGLLNGAFLTSIGGMAVVAVLAAEATLKREWNICDDTPAYLYLARRFWESGELLDQFNMRRLTSFGTGSFFQGLSMGPLGDNTLHSFDEVIGAVLLASFAFAAVRMRERAWMFLLPVPLLLNQSAFGLTNSSPTFTIFAILLVVLVEVLDCLRKGQVERIATVRFALFAFVLLTLLRPTAGIMLLPVIGWLVLVAIDRRSSVFDRWVVAGLAASFLPWAVLQWRDVGTPFFPLFSGHASELFPINGYTDLVPIGPHVLASLGQLVNSNLSILLVLGAFAAVGLGHAMGTRMLWRPWVTYGVIAGSGLSAFLLIAILLRRHDLPLELLVRRFTAPVLMAVGLAPVFALFASTREAEPRPALRRLGQLASVLLVAALPLGLVLTTARDLPSRVLDGVIGQSLAFDRFAGKQVASAQVRDRLADAKDVLTAVDLPHLLLDRRYSMSTYDFAGAMAPRGEFPFEGDLQAQRRWLSDQGVDYLVVQQSGTSSCLYTASGWSTNLKADDVTADWAPNILAWIRFTDALQREPGGSERFGDLVVIPVTRG